MELLSAKHSIIFSNNICMVQRDDSTVQNRFNHFNSRRRSVFGNQSRDKHICIYNCIAGHALTLPAAF